MVAASVDFSLKLTPPIVVFHWDTSEIHCSTLRRRQNLKRGLKPRICHFWRMSTNDPNADGHETASMDTMMEAPGVEIGQDAAAKTVRHTCINLSIVKLGRTPIGTDLMKHSWKNGWSQTRVLNVKPSRDSEVHHWRCSATYAGAQDEPQMLGCEQQVRAPVPLNNLHFEEGDHTSLKGLLVDYNFHLVHKTQSEQNLANISCFRCDPSPTPSKRCCRTGWPPVGLTTELAREGEEVEAGEQRGNLLDKQVFYVCFTCAWFVYVRIYFHWIKFLIF